jgi:hypothetical protein
VENHAEPGLHRIITKGAFASVASICDAIVESVRLLRHRNTQIHSEAVAQGRRFIRRLKTRDDVDAMLLHAKRRYLGAGIRLDPRDPRREITIADQLD